MLLWFLWWGYKEFHETPMNCMVLGTHLGVLLYPNTTLFNYFIGISSFPEKMWVAPVASLLSLVRPLAAHFPLVGTLGRKRLPYWRTQGIGAKVHVRGKATKGDVRKEWFVLEIVGYGLRLSNCNAISIEGYSVEVGAL